LTDARPTLVELRVADPPEAWERVGFAVDEQGCVDLDGVRIRLGVESGEDITAWMLSGVPADADLDGLPTLTAGPGQSPPVRPGRHPNGATAIDHLVALTPDFDRTRERLIAAGLDHRRTRETGEARRQAFFVMGPCLLELVGPVDSEVRFWGLTLVVEDLDAAAAVLGEHLGAIRDAVQPGRRIATVRQGAGLGTRMALMTSRPLG
jgi:hypothetical protein